MIKYKIVYIYEDNRMDLHGGIGWDSIEEASHVINRSGWNEEARLSVSDEKWYWLDGFVKVYKSTTEDPHHRRPTYAGILAVDIDYDKIEKFKGA